MCYSFKMFTNIIHGRLAKWVDDNKCLPECQAGICKRGDIEDFNTCCKLFDTMIKRICFYGVKISGWKIEISMETIQNKFLK